nr:hypothetical protein [Pseudogemmobacter faecipullorum]
MIQRIQQGLLAEGIKVPLTWLCAWFGVPRRTVYYRPTKAAPKVDPRFAEPIKAMIGQEPSFGYRTVAWLLGFNKNTVQRVFQLKGWQVRKRPIGMRPRIEAIPSADQPTCAGSGPGAMAGPRWPWSSIATPASCWAGICHDPARPQPQPVRWSMP